jgi:Putative adhesin
MHLAPTTRLVRLTVFLTLSATQARPQPATDFHHTLTISPAEAVMLNIALTKADLEVFYSRDGQVTMTASGHDSAGAKLDEPTLKSTLSIEQNGNHITLRQLPNSGGSIHYRFDVPYRTEVTTAVDRGAQTFSGLLGPIRAIAAQGNIKASYVAKGVQAQLESGNIDLEVIGEKAGANTKSGNISATRMPQGVDARTGDGDITLTVVGASSAKVTSGAGRIKVIGAQSTLDASTQSGELHVKAEPHGDWLLNSISGTLRLELPPVFKANLDASSDSGTLQLNRDDLPAPSDPLHLLQKLNAGGPNIRAHTFTGKIVIR